MGEVSFHAVLLTLWCAHLISSNAECRLTQACTQTYSMDSDKLKLVKVCTVSLLDGSLPLLDILCKDSVNSDFMKSSRMFTETPQERMSQNIELLDSLYHLHVLNSLLILCFAHQRPSRSRCKHLMPVNSQPPVLLDIKESPLKEVLHYSTRVLNHFGCDKSHTLLLSSLHSRRLSQLSILTFSL